MTLRTRSLARLGLDRRELRAWAMYDWANSGFQVTIVTAIFPVYFTRTVAADLPPASALARFAAATTIALAIIALLSPVLGAIADYKAAKKRFLAVFLGIGLVSTAALSFVGRGDWLAALVCFGLANIGVSGSLVFYESLLPHIARSDEIDRVSSAGYAVGYLGGGLLLAVNLAWILRPALFGLPDAGAAARLSFLSVVVWWLAFSIPLFRHVPEPPRRLEPDERSGRQPVAAALARLATTLRELRSFRQTFLLLVAFVLYNDGINTIIRMAASYGAQIGIPESALIPAFLMVQFVGVPFAFLFGGLAGRIGAKRAIYLALAVYTGISIFGYFMQTALHFYLLAALVATVQGGSQALGRSLFASMIPRDKSSEFFGFFSIFEKFGGILGPAIFGATVAATGSGRMAILSVVAFFLLGALVLAFVDVPEGQRAARIAERGTA